MEREDWGTEKMKPEKCRKNANGAKSLFTKHCLNEAVCLSKKQFFKPLF